jgi:hypothetical protein
MGNTETFKMTFSGPRVTLDVIINQIEAGEYVGIALDLGRIPQEQLLAFKENLESIKSRVETNDLSSLTKDDILGNLLYSTALSYFSELDLFNYINSKTTGVTSIRFPSESKFSIELSVESFFGIPMSVSQSDLVMDVDRIMTLVKALDGNNNKAKDFLMTSGMNSSALEHLVPEQLFSSPDNPAKGISAIKALKIANNLGVPIYRINQTNINSILQHLQVNPEIISDIQNAVNAGKEVTISRTDITYDGWTGCGYTVINPHTGTGAYLISGGFSGSNNKLPEAGLASFNAFFFLSLWCDFFTGTISDVAQAIGATADDIVRISKVTFFMTVILSFVDLLIDINKIANSDMSVSAKRKAVIACSATAVLTIAITYAFLRSSLPSLLGYTISTALLGSMLFALQCFENAALEMIREQDENP